MTLGDLALAVGILVDDATVAIENITHHLENGEPLHDAILTGSGEIAVPTFVSTLSICIVFVPMFLLSGVARYLFVPMAEAVVLAMCASYLFSRTLIPTLAMYLMKASPGGSPRTGGRFGGGHERPGGRGREGDGKAHWRDYTGRGLFIDRQGGAVGGGVAG
jgi:multidrug efflux pump subunit AcrB